MIRIAVIFESSPFDRKGLFNAVHNRIRHLHSTGECEIDAYCIHSRDTAFTRRVRHTPRVSFVDQVTVDDVRYKMLWYDFSVIDHILVYKLHKHPFFFSRFLSRNVELLKGYDCICAHSFSGAYFAYEASRRFDVPYIVTWHGSDIHTHPWRNSMILKDTRLLMEGASNNLFVSRALMSESDRIVTAVRKEVLYNGVSTSFKRYSQQRREELQHQYGIRTGERVVAFAGSIVAVKNVLSLQQIFHSIKETYDGTVRFWMMGDGKLRSQVQEAMEKDGSIDVRFWGNVPAEEMPLLLNCVDVLILPSFNEGLGMVCAEAIRCGAVAIGSEVGGIPEVIGREYTVPLGAGFVEGISSLAVRMLQEPQHQTLPAELDWSSTAAKELSLIKSVLESE